MHIMHVYIKIKPECVDDFIKATIDNARNSVKEPGVARFDFLQRQDDPAQFVLCEVYHSLEDVDKHKQTEHFNRWFETVKDMMPEPRTRNFYRNIFPEDGGR
jgi:quinol monooxygenase YgiN